MTTPPAAFTRAALRRHALRLEYATVAWNVLEALVAIAAALAAGSVALLAFGIDSCVETSSGLILIWRLRAEASARSHAEIESLDHRARRLVGLSLFALAAWVAFDAGSSLLARAAPEPTLVGVVLLVVSLAVMLWLARAKHRAAQALGSRALASDAFQTTACWWLSLVALSGLALNAALGWWWADPVAALAMLPLILHEAREAWAGEACGCESSAACAASEAAEAPSRPPTP
jgi:divalent metal cation (Fe/Co/Zn/Cd) transporter